MQADLTESVQASIRPGEMVDTYYYGETNIEKQAYPCVVNERFVQQFTNLGQGSSQFILSPAQGMSDIVLTMTMPTIATTTGLALPTGWGYNLINRVSVRYGSSAQYFWTGSQILLQNLMDSENNTKVDSIAAYGGQYATAAACSGAAAYVYLKLPHNSCRASGKPLPFPSDLLVQPVVITVELFAASNVFIVGTGGSIATAPAALAFAQLQLKQETLTDTSDLLARRIDMNSHAYTFPLMYFCQQETQVPLSTQAAQSVNLTGFRAGEVRSIVLWLTGNASTVNNNTGVYNPMNWVQPSFLQIQYNGEIFTRFDYLSGPLWNIVNDQKASQVNMTLPLPSNLAPGATAVTWLECPFSQTNVPFDKEMKLVHGKPVLNAVVQVIITPPQSGAAGYDATGYVLHAMYVYNASLLCSRGSAEYIF